MLFKKINITIIMFLFTLTRLYSQEVIEKYPNGNIKTKYNLVNNQIDGELKSYYEDKTLNYVIHFKNGKQEGETVVFYSNGVVKKKILFKDNLQHGKSLYFNEVGKLIKEELWKEGKLR